MVDVSEIDLILLKEGDRETVNFVVSWLQPRLKAFFRGQLSGRDQMDADDLVQDSLIVFLKKRNRLQNNGHILPMAFSIARNKIKEHWDRYYTVQMRNRNVEDTLDAVYGMSDVDFTRDYEKNQFLTHILKGLSAEQKRMLEMSASGSSSTEIGEALGMNPNTVRGTMRKTISALRARFAKDL